MKGEQYLLLLLVVVIMPCFTSTSEAFSIPERLEFDLTYTGIPAGRAVQEVQQIGNETRIISTAKSASWLKFFFPVDDRIESIQIPAATPLSIGLPRFYSERKSEGRTRVQRDAVFDRQKMEVTTSDLLKMSRSTKKISDKTYDTLSSFFYFRSMPLKVGSSYQIEMFDGNRIWDTEVKVLRHEEIETPLGVFKTVVIHPILQSEGIFARMGAMYIWLTDDNRRIPVQMKSKVAVGSITATLTGGSYWPTPK
jgi:hypothetical protein